ncbi:MAG: SapC family protein [Cohaesibacter sp.]|jgi:hypothetical protein|nr:SapC family protein [Cohaesibacter sp.]
MSKKNKKTQAEKKVEPVIYSKVEPLNAERHGALKLKAVADQAHVRSMNSVMLTTTEFPSAAQNYPIVFAKVEDSFVPFVVTGYKQGENLYVGEDGRWREDSYIPAFVRRYPFTFMEDTEKGSLTLCIDAASSLLSEEEGELLYKDGKPSELIDNALAFTKAFHLEAEKTKIFCKQLVEADLLVEQNANFTLPGNETAVISGFSIVDEKKFSELDDEAFLALRKTGALDAIYCHLISMRSWGEILSGKANQLDAEKKAS